MLLEAIRKNAGTMGEKPAYRCGGKTLTYAGLWAGACRLAAFLAKGSGPVLVYGHKSPDMPLAFLACLLAGRAYLPCDRSIPPERLAYIRRASGTALALLGEPGEPAPAPLRDIALPVRRALAVGGETSVTLPRDPGRDAYLLFTSGSTGAPKGVRVTLRNLEHFVAWALAQPGIAASAGGVCVNQALFSFDLSVADLWPTFAAGGTVFALEADVQRAFAALYRALGQSGGTRLTGTPSFLRLCLCDPVFDRSLMPGLQTVFCCGEVLPPRTARTLCRRFPGLHLLNAYGPTEATCAVCAVEVGEGAPPNGSLPVGVLADAAAGVVILDEAGRPLPPGRPGEICLTGPSVAAGYLNAPAGGFFTLDGQPAYRTGDTGFCREGLLWYLGRRDRQIKYKGYRIEPGEVEQALAALPQVAEAAVLPLRRGGEVAGLAACIRWQGTPLTPAECRERLGGVLPGYMLPRRWLTLAALPHNANGKCDYRRLEELLDEEIAGRRDQ